MVEMTSYIDRIRKLPALDRLAYWVKEREAVRLRKERGDPKPWTDDPIFQSYRFCNVRRTDDKVSKWLMENWYWPFFDHPNMLAAVAVARFVNLPSSLGEVSPHIFGRPKGLGPGWEDVKRRLRELKKFGPIFNGAYMVRGNTKVSPDKVGTVIDEYVRPMVGNVGNDYSRNYLELAHEKIAANYGFGSFMAGQVVADLRWAVKGRWADRNNWAPVGPGSARGMGWALYGDERETAAAEFVRDGEAFSHVLQFDLIPKLKKRLPGTIIDRLEAMDYQNCLCEFDKYNRTLFGLGRPKATYNGRD